MSTTALIFALAIAGCGGAKMTPAPGLTGIAGNVIAQGSDPSSTTFVYVVDTSTNKLYVYPGGVNNPAPIRSVTPADKPHAVVTDAAGNVYVSSTESGEIEVYASGATSLLYTITGLNHPQALTIDGNGNLYSADVNASVITEFAPGGTTPIATFATNAAPLGGVAVDSNGTVYVDETGGVIEACNPTCATLPGVTGPSSATGGLAFTGTTLNVAGGRVVAHYDTSTWTLTGSTTYGGGIGVVRFITAAGGVLSVPFASSSLAPSAVYVSSGQTITNSLHVPYGAAIGP